MGLALIVVALTANWLDIGNPGFGPKKQVAVLLGLLLFSLAIDLLRASRMKTLPNGLASLSSPLRGKIVEIILFGYEGGTAAGPRSPFISL